MHTTTKSQKIRLIIAIAIALIGIVNVYQVFKISEDVIKFMLGITFIVSAGIFIWVGIDMMKSKT
ncbi:hypothetical protein [Ekhidna sp.]|jgi:hypothetical protein|uniref:hypothetical protein n=1 Tax=Ekhidna sp. TaxID=2608089 RepID=UPI0032ECCB62